MSTEDTIEPNDSDIRNSAVQAEVLRILARHNDHAAPQALLDAARDPGNVLHQFFVWDDTEAAARYRLAQAGALFRRVKYQVVRLDAEKREVVFSTIRGATSVPDERKKTNSASYGRTNKVMGDAERRASVLRGLVRDLVALRNKFAKYNELHDVWVVIDDAAMMYDPPSTKAGKRGGQHPPPPVA